MLFKDLTMTWTFSMAETLHVHVSVTFSFFPRIQNSIICIIIFVYFAGSYFLIFFSWFDYSFFFFLLQDLIIVVSGYNLKTNIILILRALPFQHDRHNTYGYAMHCTAHSKRRSENGTKIFLLFFKNES